MSVVKAIFFGLLLCVFTLTGFWGYTNYLKPKVGTVSQVKAKPDQYLGRVLITGIANNIYPNDGVVEIVDEKACCNLLLRVPMTPSQKSQLGASSVYEGTLPVKGQTIEVLGKLGKEQEGYSINVTEIKSQGQVIIKEI